MYKPFAGFRMQLSCNLSAMTFLVPVSRSIFSFYSFSTILVHNWLSNQRAECMTLSLLSVACVETTCPRTALRILVTENAQCCSVLIVISCKNPVAAGACPTYQWRWWNTSQRTHQRGTRVPRRKYSNQYRLQTGMASKNNQWTTDNVARHPVIPVSTFINPDPFLFGHFIPRPLIWHRGPRPRAHWYMCTD